MGNSLIGRLNDLAHLSPDEIQHKISSPWVNFGKLTVAEVMAMDQRRMYITCHTDHSGTLVSLNAPNWCDLEGDTECRWWFCFEERWNGEPPCPN